VENCEQGLIVNLKSQEEHDKMLELSGHIVRHTLTFSKMSHGRTEVLFVPIDVCCNANFCLTTVPNYERRNDRLLIKIIPRDEIWIGPWRGSGTYGEVFEGTWNERDVAIKKFRAHESVNRETFLKEARNSCEMSHSNIVQFFGIVDNPESGELLLVMELMCGSLADLLKTRCLEHSEIVRYALDIAKGLRYLHKRDPKIIHRDLKPANILVNSHGAKLADFGQSRTLIQDALANTATGTFGFIAPEILAEVPYDERVDIFSLGAVIFTMNTNKVLPIKKLKRLQKISAEITNQELQQLVVACCQTDPARRPSVDQCIDILEKLV
jgi:serine/threonine protein kinase